LTKDKIFQLEDFYENSIQLVNRSIFVVRKTTKKTEAVSLLSALSIIKVNMAGLHPVVMNEQDSWSVWMIFVAMRIVQFLRTTS